MKVTFVISALTLLAATASARIASISVPTTIGVGSTVLVKINGEDYIQSVQDVAIAFGIQNASRPIPDSLGQYLSSRYLGPDESNIVGTINHYITVPAHQAHGNYTFTGELFSLVGAEYESDVESFNVTTTVGRFTSSTYVTSSS